METPEKVTIPITSTVTEEKDITLPYFTKSDIRAYKAISQLYALEVYKCISQPRIALVSLSTMFTSNEDEHECTEAEFMDFYNQVQERLNALVK